ncbi:MAG TPA: DMT family transporter, partial [Balneolaceae bacterium]|nr:DMT family transporter [Balneolaceae bacterium]
MRFSKKSIVELSLLLVAIIWGLNLSVIKTSLAELKAFPFNALRFIFATMLMWAVLLWRGQQFTIPKKDWLPLLGLALLGNLIYQVLFIIGVDFTQAANAAVMLGTIPVWVAIFSHFGGFEKLNAYKSIGVTFAFLGIVIIMVGGKQVFSFTSNTVKGDLMIILAAMVFAGYTILSKSFLKRYTPIQFTTIMTTIGCIVLVIIGLPGLMQMDWESVSFVAYGGALYSGLLAIGAAFLIWNYGLQTVGAVYTSTFQNLVPV